jgi:hypothetical protein
LSFFGCTSLASATFESGSELRLITQSAFS